MSLVDFALVANEDETAAVGLLMLGEEVTACVEVVKVWPALLDLISVLMPLFKVSVWVEA